MTGLEQLRADCDSCAGLCCVAPAFARSSDFAADKPAGTPCPQLTAEFRCGIHAGLRDHGYAGCTAFDCFGAGQQVTTVTFGGRDWHDDGVAGPMFGTFTIMRQLHELLWYLTDALARPVDAPLREDLRRSLADTRRHTQGDPDAVLAVDVAAHRQSVDVLLTRVSTQVRAASPGPQRRLGGADLVGARLPGADLRGATLRGAYLIGADLAGADLRLADVIGADLRGADVAGADLSDTLFLTQFQVNAAGGDETTALPPAILAPPHWTGRRHRPARRRSPARRR